MARLFLISHSDKEPAYKFNAMKDVNVLSWNNTLRHWRKFINREGIYLDNGTPKTSSLCFWGEYEVYSNATIINTIVSPLAIHYNLLPARHFLPISKNFINTDPYVYGCFRHICCRRGNKQYKQNDIIVFGKFIDSTHFEFDTVIVVRGLVETSNVPLSDQYYNASILPLVLQKSPYNNFVDGEIYSSTKPYYSFVPCLPKCLKINDDGEYSETVPMHFVKPVLDLNEFGENAVGMTSKIIPSKKIKQDLTPIFWEKITDAVKNAGLMQGIFINKIDNELTF